MAIKFSVGLPLYRTGNAVEFCIQSVLNQSRPADEIVIVDNLVSRSKSCVQRWTVNPKVKYVNSGHNIGAFANFVRAWECSSHRYFCWVSDDDFLHPEALAAYEMNIDESSDLNYVAWCGLPSVFYSSTGSRITGNRFTSFEATSFLERVKLICQYGQWNYPLYSMYDRTLVSIDWLKKFCNWPLGTSSLDWSWTYAVAAHGCIKLIPSHLYFYNQDNWAPGVDWEARENNVFAKNLGPHSSEILSTKELHALSTNMMAFLFVVSSFQGNLDPSDINSLFHIFFLSTSSPNAIILKESYNKLKLEPHISPRYLLTGILEAIEQVKPRFTEEIRSFGFSDQVVDSVSDSFAHTSDSIWGQTHLLRMMRKLLWSPIRNKKADRNANGEIVVIPKL